MEKYTIYCTEEQTRKALELGAPIEFEVECPVNLETLERSPYPDIKMGKDGEPILIIPTAEQMKGWLGEQESISNIIISQIYTTQEWQFEIYDAKNNLLYFADWVKPSRKEATLTAIDVALDYLIKNKK